MNWDAISALAEALGAIAVLATLGYLAIQVRHSRVLLERNEKLALGSTYQNRAVFRAEFIKTVVDSEYLAPILAKTDGFTNIAAIDDLSAEEKVRLRYHIDHFLLMIDNLLFQEELGQLSFFEKSEESATVYLKLLTDLEPFAAELGGLSPPPRLVTFWSRHRSGSDN